MQNCAGVAYWFVTAREAAMTRPRSRRALLRAALLSLVLVGGLALPTSAATNATAAAAYRPDGLIRFFSYRYEGGFQFKNRTPWSGNDVYNSTGQYQTEYVDLLVEEGTYLVFKVKIENDGSSSDRFLVTGSGTANWVVKYFRGTTNITSAVVAGTYQTPPLLHGESLVFRVEVKVDPDVATKSRLVTISSVGNPNRTDTVRLNGSFHVCGC
jgi:hypothetical protein